MSTVVKNYSCILYPELVEYLNEKEIPYTIKAGYGKGEQRIMFSINESQDDDVFKKIIKIRYTLLCTKERVFSEKEFNSAKWFSMWCDNMKIEENEDSDTFQYECNFGKGRYYHKKQVNPYVVDKTVKWTSNRFFISGYLSSTHLFVKDKTKYLLMDSGFDEFEYWPVLYAKSREQMKDVYQIIPKHKLSDTALILEESESCKKKACKVCGSVQYVIDGGFQLKVKEEYLENGIHVYQTNELFGYGFTNNCVIVSREFYNFIKKNHMDKSLHFNPISTVK